MSEFKAGFIDAYQADLLSMLNLAEELSLVQAPGVIIKGNPYSDNIEYIVAGKKLEEHDTETVEGIQAHTEVAVGMTLVYSLGARATIQLFSSEFDAMIPPESLISEIEKKEVADSLVKRAQDEIDNAEYDYSAYNFINTDTDDRISVKHVHLKCKSSNVHARSLILSISDEYVSKEITINEYPVTFEGDTILDISQSTSPVDDSTLIEASELFYNNGTPEDMAVILKLFNSELMDAQQDDYEIAELLKRFDAIGKKEQLQRILNDMKQKAKEAKISNAFSFTSPEMTLPSAIELDEYKELLSQLRA